MSSYHARYNIVCQLLVTGRWFSLGTPVSSTIKTDRHDITDILLKQGVKHHKATKLHVIPLTYNYCFLSHYNTCIFQIILSSSVDNSDPRKSTNPLILSQYCAWSIFPGRQKVGYVNVLIIMKKKCKQWWSSISPISTKQTIISHLNWTKKTMTWSCKSRSWLGTGTKMWQC